MRTYYTAKDAADYLGISLRAMREACASGRVPSERDGNAYYIEEADLEAHRAWREAHGLKGRVWARRRNKEARQAREAVDGRG